VPEVVAWARRHQLVVSLDLIFGVPGTTLDDWNTDLESALALDPDHLSTYGLTYEKGTPLWKQWHRGLIRAVDEDTEAAMYERAIERLTAAGFEHYEVSNFARPGHRCRHNETYWANEAYYGCGLGAVRYVHGVREGNVRDVQQYIRRLQAGQSVTAWREELPPWERACETLILQLRRRQGITRSHFREQTGYTLNELLGPALSEAIDDGLLEDDGQAIRLSRRGLLVADTVLAHLWTAACRNQVRRARRLPVL
ncbi:MAG: coproporphyrinogen-III oxidase family protein, partial [Thermogemmata sp.]|nr:coproporphyrinogen-III oxidase family protein [Thermogemmata sp.]